MKENNIIVLNIIEYSHLRPNEPSRSFKIKRKERGQLKKTLFVRRKSNSNE